MRGQELREIFCSCCFVFGTIRAKSEQNRDGTQDCNTFEKDDEHKFSFFFRGGNVGACEALPLSFRRGVFKRGSSRVRTNLNDIKESTDAHPMKRSLTPETLLTAFFFKGRSVLDVRPSLPIPDLPLETRVFITFLHYRISHLSLAMLAIF